MMSESERRIEYLAVDDIVPAERNPKLHSPDIAASMRRFQFTEPVLLDERTGRLVAGHGRVEALAALALEPDAVPPDGVQVVDGRWLVPVVRGWASRDDEEASAYLVASNRLTEIGGWDDAELAALLEQVAVSPDGLDGVGYSSDDLEQLLVHVREHDRQLPGDVDPDDVPPVPSEPVTQRGGGMATW